MYTHTFVFPNHLRVSCRHDSSLPLDISGCIPKKKDVLSYNHSPMIRSTEFNVDTILSIVHNQILLIDPIMSFVFSPHPGSNLDFMHLVLTSLQSPSI